MIYIIQLVYVKPGEEHIFEEFESIAIPIIAKYNGRMILRLRPNQQAVIENSVSVPYELHLVEFESEEDLQRFQSDDQRLKYLHLKERSIEKVMLIKGSKI